MASSDSGLGGMVIGESEIEGRAVRSSVRWRLGLIIRFALPVAVKTVRSDTTTLLARDACPGRKSSSLRRLLLRLELRMGLPLSMSHGEASWGRFSGRGGVVPGDFGGVGGRSDDAVSAGSGEACSQSWIRSRECEERKPWRPNDGRGIADACHAGRDRVSHFRAERHFPGR